MAEKATKKSSQKRGLIFYIYPAFLYILPKNIISRLGGIFARWRPPHNIKMLILNTFCRMYGINLKEAELKLSEYNSLNEFFTRALKRNARPIHKGKKIITSPVDGKILNFGVIKKGNIIQVKGNETPIKDILATERHYKKFLGGIWITIYLAPKDYHRIHSPVSGNIIEYSYQSGQLMPVNQLAIDNIRSLFSKNERVTSFIQTPFGLTALTKIGATNVGSIRVTYDDNLSTNKCIRQSKKYIYKKSIIINKGNELGRFEMGSMVILFIEKEKAQWRNLKKNQNIKYGEAIGSFLDRGR